MILVDTSVWVDHLRASDKTLVEILNKSQVFMHPFVLGELACGNLRNRSEILTLLKDLPRALIATDDEVLFLIERHTLMGRGIGYVDAHLLSSTKLDGATRLWTRDKRLNKLAMRFGVNFEE